MPVIKEMIISNTRSYTVGMIDAYKYNRQLEVIGLSEVGIPLGQLVMSYPTILIFDGAGRVQKYNGLRTAAKINLGMDFY